LKFGAEFSFQLLNQRPIVRKNSSIPDPAKEFGEFFKGSKRWLGDVDH
jgi:hypothetical protein